VLVKSDAGFSPHINHVPRFLRKYAVNWNIPFNLLKILHFSGNSSSIFVTSKHQQKRYLMMKKTIIEIKARCENPDKVRKILKTRSAIYVGKDHQIDTYFKVNTGRLKLREGKIENYLIHYNRENTKGPKKSSVLLYKTNPGSSLKSILTKALGVLVVVEKQREIYFIENVKFHIDNVKNLGRFVEIEAIGEGSKSDRKKLDEQCRHFLELFEIASKDLIPNSYSDMLE
jgi:adenylate cyclase class 2